jgi:hypothetical protein
VKSPKAAHILTQGPPLPDTTGTADARSPKALLIEMFREVVLNKNADLIAQYYHPDFLLETNGELQDLDAFLQGHRRVYATDISYAVRYDDDAWVESDGRVAARIWIRTQTGAAAPVEFEIVLIATFVDQKIHRVWETTWPDWRAVRAFESYQPAR